MATVAPQFDIPRSVARTISRLRWLVRGYVWLEGLFALAIVAGAAYWIGLLLDWLFEPTPAVRFLLWLGAGAATAWALYRYIFRRTFAKLPDASLALLIERQYPSLREGLVTTVQAGDGRRREGYHPQLIAQTSRTAEEAVGSIRLGQVFNRRPLAVKGLLALVAVGSIALFAWQAPEAYSFWGERMAFSRDLWPRENHISVAGFDREQRVREVRVARDSTFEVLVAASIDDGFVAPEEVEIRWRRASDGLGSRDPMLKVGEAVAGRDTAQQFRYEFKVTSDIEFDVIGGDDRIRNLRLVAVERPAVSSAALEINYPEYLDRLPRRIALSKRAELPEGSWGVCNVEATKPLASARVYDPSLQQELPWTIDPADPTQLSFPLTANQGDLKLAISLVDTDGVESLSPYGLAVSVVPDEPPELSVQLRGIGTAVTPQARIPVAGTVTDDYAVRDVWFEYQVDAAAPERRPLEGIAAGFPRLKITESFDLAEDDPDSEQPLVALKPGQRLAFRLQADDYYDLDDKLHAGVSQRFLLDVVTPSQLRALLEKRELGLRQRFEAITEKMTGVRDLLERIEPPVADASPADEESESARQLRRDLSRISGAGQNATQMAFETGGVAQGFEEILAELINNRVDTDELRNRLEDGIAAPLRVIADDQLPELQRLLAEHLQAHQARAEGAVDTLAATKIQADAIMEAMQAVLDRMLELESYNELIDLLRGIVSEQQQINDATKQQQRDKLRRLLEE
ncbi:MAG: hypothetical protein KDA44_18605 [Planctomycetales bacterium]|nr:hypothetical protein [Planctomycetales bacterium]